MPFIPHTAEDVQAMLSVIGAKEIEDLFDEIPSHLGAGRLAKTPDGVGEMQMMQRLEARAAQDAGYLCFLGAGSYDHHIPAAVWDLTQRGEFMTAYTPYQAEASQGTLQLIYEYQSMITALTAMDVSNASVYDGASGLGEAVLMAVRGNRKNKSRRVLIAGNAHPHYRQATISIVGNQGIAVDTVPASDDGLVSLHTLQAAAGDEAPVAVVISQPNFFGGMDDVDAICDWAHAQGTLVIAVVNALSLAILKPPGEWGEAGADIACGDGQPFGIPMASGGPSFGFICCRHSLVRQLPGRIIGRTNDLDGAVGYTLTLQAREQHIRRGKATSNICTNQGLLVTAATIHMAMMGASGLAAAARACHVRTRELVTALTALPGVTQRFGGAFFHEAVINLPQAADVVCNRLLDEKILGGLPLGDYFPDTPDMKNALLVCATEKRTTADIERFAQALGSVLAEVKAEVKAEVEAATQEAGA